MDNFDDFEKKEYEKARRVDYSALDLTRFLINFLWIYTQVTIALLFEVLLQIKELFSPKKPKDITGQTALVTG
jgi:hypothetical protein